MPQPCSSSTVFVQNTTGREYEAGENCLRRKIMICTLQQILFRRSNQGGRGRRACSTYDRKEACRLFFLWGNLKEKRLLGRLGVDGRVILKWLLKKTDVRAWIGLIWLRRGTSGWMLWTQYRNVGFNLAPERDKWLAVVNTVTKRRV